MLVIGLTGPSGAGKGEVSRLLQAQGAAIIDADEVYHALLVPPSPCLDALSEAFGAEILTPDGTLDRKRLAAIVFGEPDAEIRKEQIKRLNGITHGYVLARADEILADMEARGVRAAILDAPALYESGGDKRCDLNVTVLSDRETRKRRIVLRDGLTEEEAEARINAQHPDSFYTERADTVLLNDTTPEEFRERVASFVEETILPRL